MFAAIAAVLVIAYSHLGLRQILDPGGMRHHAAFSGNANSGSMQGLCGSADFTVSGRSVLNEPTTVPRHVLTNVSNIKCRQP